MYGYVCASQRDGDGETGVSAVDDNFSTSVSTCVSVAVINVDSQSLFSYPALVQSNTVNYAATMLAHTQGALRDTVLQEPFSGMDSPFSEKEPQVAGKSPHLGMSVCVCIHVNPVTVAAAGAEEKGGAAQDSKDGRGGGGGEAKGKKRATTHYRHV